MQFKSLLATSFSAILLVVGAAPSPNVNPTILTLAEMEAWVHSMDPANVTIHGDPFGGLKARANTVTVTFCTTRSGTICTGSCSVVSGNGICIPASGTNCLAATGEVTFCDRGGCGGSCNELNSCGTRLENGFCATPGTQSIGIPAST